MRKLLSGLIFASVILSGNLYAKKIEQTICFSKSSCSDRYAYAVLGNDVNLCGGKCQGKTLAQMNKEGWKLTQVITGLQSSFGMLFTREK